MNALHQALENGADLYYKPKRVALVYLQYKKAVDVMFASIVFLLLFLFAVLWIFFGFEVAQWVIYIPFAFTYVVMTIIGMAAQQESRMLQKVIDMAENETGTRLTPEMARPLVHQIIGYLFAQKVVEENK